MVECYKPIIISCCNRSSINFKDLHDYVAEVVDDFDGNAAEFGILKWTGGVASQAQS